MIAETVSKIEGWQEVQDTLKEYREGGVLELKQYREIGTIEECHKAREKQTPMKHHHTRLSYADDKIRESVCPNCLLVICTEEQSYPKFCTWCGQAIDWGGE